MRYSNISAEEKKKGTLHNHYDWISAMAVLSRLRASATMGQRSPRTTSSDDVTLPIQLPPATTFRQTQKSEGGVQDSMSLDLPCAQRADPTGSSPPAAEAAEGASAPSLRLCKSAGGTVELEGDIWGVASASPDRRWRPIRLALSKKTLGKA